MKTRTRNHNYIQHMAKKDKSSKSGNKFGKSSSGASAKSEAVSNVVANPRLVAIIKGFDAARAQVKSYLIDLAEAIQNEQCTRAEVVASICVARGVEKTTAESQYTRYKDLFEKPDVLEQAKKGDVTVREMRAPKNPQKKPSAKKAAENREKRFSRAVKEIVKCAKEGGEDIATILATIKAALKDGGVK